MRKTKEKNQNKNVENLLNHKWKKNIDKNSKAREDRRGDLPFNLARI